MSQLSFDQVMSLVAVALTGHICALLGLWRANYAQNKWGRIIQEREISTSQLKRERWHSLVILMHPLWIFLFWKMEWIRFGTGLISEQLFTASIGLIWLEAWFYVSHRLLHTTWLWPWHLEHHKSVRTTPWSGLSFSIQEKVFFNLGYLLGMAVFSRFYMMSFETLCFVYVTYLMINALGHSNYEAFSKDYTQSSLGKFWATASFHVLHHQSSKYNYGLATRFLDRFFGTENPDYEQSFQNLGCSDDKKN